MKSQSRINTRFRVLLEIAGRQPGVKQLELADALGITPQAVSEYIKELVSIGLIVTGGPLDYRVTKSGYQELIMGGRELKRATSSIFEEITNTIYALPAIASRDIQQGEKVSLSMVDGFLYAGDLRSEAVSWGIAIKSVKKGEDIGIKDIQGIISMEPGEIEIIKVPNIICGGSRGVDLEKLSSHLEGCKYIGAIGIEALVSLEKIGIKPKFFFGAKEASIEAAMHGISYKLAVVESELQDFMELLESRDIKYSIVTFSK